MSLRLFIPAFLLVFCSHTFAQSSLPEFAPIGAVWSYNSIDECGQNGPLSIVDHLESVGNDTIGGKACRKLHGLWSQTYVYRDSLKIYWYVQGEPYGPNKWRILYDFTKEPGDTFYIPQYVDSIPVRVVSKGIDTVNGFAIPYMNLTCSNGYCSGFQGKVLLNIGAEVYFFPTYNLSNCKHWINLKCYSDTVIGIYNADGSCGSSAIELEVTPSLTIGPNPFAHSLRITGLVKSARRVTLTNVLGQDVYHRPISFGTQELELNLSSLHAGLYYLLIDDGPLGTQSKRIVKLE